MELVGLLRGYWRPLLEWIQDASMIHIPYKYKDPKTKKTYTRFIRVAIRPMIPIEIVFPKAGLKTILGMIKPAGNKDYIRDKSKKNKRAFEMVRKMMSLKELPDDWPKYNHIITNILGQHAVAFHPLGVKEDMELETGEGL